MSAEKHIQKRKMEQQFPPSVDMNRMVNDLLKPFLVADRAFIARVKKIILRMYGLPEDMEYFCGALPCSLMRADLHYLEELEYMVTEKTDGVRHLMLIFRDDQHVYSLLVDRGFRFYYTNVKFLDFLREGIGTLLDGEIIWEPTGFKFYVHDLVCMSGKRNVAALDYVSRMKHVVDIVRWGCFPPEDGNEHIQLLPKKLFPLTNLKQLWFDIIPHLQHRCDGLILTPNELPHTGKKNKLMFKYKGPDDHTIDLQLDRKLDQCVGEVEGLPHTSDGLGPPYLAYQLQTWDTQDRHDFCEISMAPQRWASIGIPDPDRARGAILECKYNSDRTMWVPIAWRNDKLGILGLICWAKDTKTKISVPNDIYTIRRTIETMIEGLTIEELLNISRHLGEKKTHRK
jgi:hypothetical protein